MPDTLSFLVLGLTLALSLLALYVVTLFIRRHNALKDIRLYQQLLDE